MKPRYVLIDSKRMIALSEHDTAEEAGKAGRKYLALNAELIFGGRDVDDCGRSVRVGLVLVVERGRLQQVGDFAWSRFLKATRSK